ncbi:KH domain-containing protein [Bdellovibrio bacteriovorus]
MSDLKVIKKRSDNNLLDIDLDEAREDGRDLLERVIKGIVDYPESVSVSYAVGDKTTVYKVECDKKCLGQVIGSKGKNITGVRAVIAATLARKGIRAIVEIPYHIIEA